MPNVATRVVTLDFEHQGVAPYEAARMTADSIKFILESDEQMLGRYSVERVKKAAQQEREGLDRSDTDWNFWEKSRRAKGKKPRMRNPTRNPIIGLDYDADGTSYEDAERLYSDFHGRESSQLVEVESTYTVRDDLAALGVLNEMRLKLETGDRVKLEFPSEGEDVILLASSPDGRQLYLEGGDQSLDLGELGMDGPEWQRDLMLIGEIEKLQYRTQKGFDNFETIDYHHKLGEETRVKPSLVYDTLNETMAIAGGQYTVEDRGIVN